MTIAELLLAIFSIVIIYRLLKPIQQRVESFLLRLLGARGVHIIDVSIIKEKKSEPPRE